MYHKEVGLVGIDLQYICGRVNLGIDLGGQNESYSTYTIALIFRTTCQQYLLLFGLKDIRICIDQIIVLCGPCTKAPLKIQPNLPNLFPGLPRPMRCDRLALLFFISAQCHIHHIPGFLPDVSRTRR